MNYQLELEKIIDENQKLNRVPTLLLHACCAPCSSYVLEYLSNYFKITVFYYNPNITPYEEYQKRIEEVKNLIKQIPTKYPVSLIEGQYENEIYEQMIRGKEEEKEGGSRCYLCYQLRMKMTAKLAKEQQFDYFTTTLSISPYKNANWINEIGKKLEQEFNIPYLYSDFKKKGGYQRSIELSKKYKLYRQDYCGCIYSKKEREQKVNSFLIS